MPKEALEMLSFSSDRMIRPGMMKAPYVNAVDHAHARADRRADTTKYSEVDSTGAA